jgi:hypothetical protein
MTRRTNALAAVLCAALATGALPSAAWAQGPDVATTPPTAWASAPDTAPSLGRIVGEAFRDLKNLPSVENATILGIGGAGSAISHAWDSRSSDMLSSSREMDGALRHGGSLGSMQVQAAAAFATYTIGRVTNHTKATTIGADLIKAQIVTQLTTQGVKFAVGRTRPDGTSLSFPSGHTATAFATATVVQRNLGWKFGVPAYAIAAYVGASRIQDKRHYLSDVAFGAALGVVAGRSVTVGRGDARFAVSPVIAPGGGGVNFTLIGKN